MVLALNESVLFSGEGATRMFSVTCFGESGLGCECCVSVSRYVLRVFADTWTDAERLLRIKVLATGIVIESHEDEGAVEGAKAGVMIVSSERIYGGVYRDSPLAARG